MINHTVSDMMTRLRNGIRVKKAQVAVPKTKMTQTISEILKREGYIEEWFDSALENNSSVTTASAKTFAGSPQIQLILKYKGKKMTSGITNLKTISRPGVRFYAGQKEIPQVLDGLGITILSTSKGVLTDREARQIGVGGEILCMVW